MNRSISRTLRFMQMDLAASRNQSQQKKKKSPTMRNKDKRGVKALQLRQNVK